MEAYRVIHDFQDLSLEDIADTQSRENSSGSAKQRLHATPYQFLFAALAFGLLLGYLARRN